jgi:O-antigen/teichoic acid export membrane protein
VNVQPQEPLAMPEAFPSPLEATMEQRGRWIARGGVAIFVTSLLLKGTSVLASILIARHLGPTQLGQWALVTYVTGFAWLFIELGTGTAAVRLISGYRQTQPDRARRVVTTYVVFEALLAMPVAAAFLFASPWLATGLYGDPVLLPLFWLSIASLPVFALTTCQAAILQAHERVRLLAKLGLAFGIAHALLLVTFVLLFGLVGGFVASLLAGTGQLVSYLLVMRKVMPLSLLVGRPDGKLLRAMLRYALPTFGATIFLVAFNWIGASLVTSGGSVESIGHYTVAYRVAFLALYIPNAIVVPFFPLASGLYERDPLEFTRTYDHTLRYTTLFVFPLVLAISAFARPLVSLLYGEDYVDAAGLLPITAAAALLASFLSPANLAFYVTGAMRRQAILSAAVFVVGLSILLALVPSFSIEGFAWAVFAFYAALVALGPVFLGRAYPDRPYRVMSVTALPLSAIVLGVGMLLLRADLLLSNLVAFALVLGSVTVIYSRFMTPKDRRFVRSLLRGFGGAKNR